MRGEKKSKIRYVLTAILLIIVGYIVRDIARDRMIQEKISQEGLLETVRNAAISTEPVQEVQEETFLEMPSGYAFQSLNAEEQLWYFDIASCLGGMQEEVTLNKLGIDAGMGEAELDKVFQCVMADHPELFYVDGYSYTEYNRKDKRLSIHFFGKYAMTKERAKERKEEIMAAVEPLLADASRFTNEYDKVKYVYETIIKSTVYHLESADNQNIYSVFVNHMSVCQGYAKAVQYLLNRMNVECVLVQGTVDTGEGHAWNLVNVNGSYYYVDATWGDASYQTDGSEQQDTSVPEISYDYLCITTKQLLRTHILDNPVPLPNCVDTKDNYFVREGALFTSYDKEQMKALFERVQSAGRKDVTIKCADIDCYREIFEKMTEEQEIFNYLKADGNSVIYAQNEKQLSMTFWVTND